MNDDEGVDAYIGREIRTRRVLKGVAQERLADACGVPYSLVDLWEEGILRPTAHALYLVARCLGVEAGVFFPPISGIIQE